MSRERLDLTKRRIGRLFVIKEAPSRRCNGVLVRYWLCQCDCGNLVEVFTSSLRRAELAGIGSCGCLHKELLSKRRRSHGSSKTLLYERWQGIRARCYNPNHRAYKNYGGRGIEVCQEWRNDFHAFQKWALDNGYNTKLSIERKDTNGPYSPDNCKFATRTEQGRNKRNNLMIEYQNQIKSLPEWCEILNKSYVAIYTRIHRGMSEHDALSLPAPPYVPHNQRTAKKKRAKESAETNRKQ